jgi:photosystem II stability/assembly factor-like uncharacterized protein
MKNFFSSYLLWVVLALVNSNALLAQYSNATLNGPWFGYNIEPLNPYDPEFNYIVFDGLGNIIGGGQFPAPTTGSYSVTLSGVVSGTLLIGGEVIPISGQLTSLNEANIIAVGLNFKFHKIANPGALKDKITGTLTTQNNGSRTVTLNIDSQGNIISAIGLTAPVSGKVYADLGVFNGHIKTGETSNGWNELSIMGNYSDNSLTGLVALDSNSEGTTSAILTRTDNLITDWTLQTNPLTTSTMCGAMQFVSATEGWISIAPGGLLHTTDGGTTWTEKILDPTDVIDSPSDPGLNLSFISPSTGWVLKTFGSFENPQGAVVYKTIDGGTTWEKKVVSTTAGDVGFELQFVDANTGWLMLFNFNTYTATFLKTTDGGTNWVPTNGAGIFSYVDANNGWAYSSANQLPPYTIYKTTNGGTSWTSIATDNVIGEINKMKFFDLSNGWIVGKNGKILKTTNGGVDWTTITNAGITSEYKCKSVHFINPSTGWISSKRDNSNDNAIVLHTTDGGANWTTQSTPSNNDIFGIYFWDANNGWYSGDYGVIARYTGTLDVKENILNKFITIYPNPNNGTFYFSIKETNSKVKVEIYTLSGQKVYEASNFEMQPQNEINFAPQSKGIYLIKINEGENTYIEKMMVQ